MSQPIPILQGAQDLQFYSENLEQCLKTTFQFKGALIQNICNNTTHFIPNGFWDYITISFLFIIGFLLMMFFLKVILD